MQENRYVGLNEGQDMWEIDFENGTAQYIGQRVTLDDLKVNGREHLYEEYSDTIDNWLQEHGCNVIEGANADETVKRVFIDKGQTA